MRKLRDGALWNRLNEDQCRAVEQWLFGENLGYARVVERLREAGVETSVTAVRRMYQWRLVAREKEAEALELYLRGRAEVEAGMELVQALSSFPEGSEGECEVVSGGETGRLG